METNQTTINGETNNVPEQVNTPAAQAPATPKKGVLQTIKDGASAAKPKVVKVGKKLVEWTVVAATTAAVTGVALYKTYKNQQPDGTTTDEPAIDDILDNTPEEQDIPEI